MSFLNGTMTMVHSSKLPATTTQDQAVAMLQDHEFFLRCGPHMSKFDKLPNQKPVGLPASKAGQGTGTEACYKVTDVVQTLPAGIWDSNVESTYEFSDTATGVFVRILSPLKVTMETSWDIVGEEGALELVESASISCSRLLLGIVKSTSEAGWSKIHAKMIKHLEDEAAARS